MFSRLQPVTAFALFEFGEFAYSASILPLNNFNWLIPVEICCNVHEARWLSTGLVLASPEIITKLIVTSI
jgi:hypothetical protein